MSYIKELTDYLNESKTIYFNVYWGPDGINKDPEEKAKYLLDLLNGIKDGNIHHEIYEEFPKDRKVINVGDF